MALLKKRGIFMDLKNMVSGTDIRGIVSKYEDKDINLSEKEVEFIAKGFGLWITEKCDEIAKAENRKVKVAVGYDARHTGPKFSEVIRKALMEMGIDVYDCGMSITPSLFMATIFEDYKAYGAMMITASHLPSYYNGIKFFTKNGGLQKSDVNEFLEMAEKQEENLIKEEKGVEILKNLADDYASYICELIKNKIGKGDKPLKNLRIVIDAGNGAAGFFAEKVIEVLGGDTAGSQFLNPDGNFPNHIPNPEAKEAIESIKKAVLDNNADFGIIFDADGDRSAFIDNTGREINRNNLIALLSDILLKQTPGATIVTDSVTSAGLKKFIENHGGKHHRFKRGYKNVINEAKRLNNEGVYIPLAIETSGHAAFINNYFLDDGAYMAALLLIQLVKSKKEGVNFTDILNEVEEAAEEKEIRFTIKAEDFRSEGNKVLEALGEYAGNVKGWEMETPNYEGVRIICDGNSWFLLRLSLHEPLLCLNIETAEKGKIEEIQGQIYEFLKDFDKVDITPIKK